MSCLAIIDSFWDLIIQPKSGNVVYYLSCMWSWCSQSGITRERNVRKADCLEHSVARKENVWKVECLKNSVARNENVWKVECLKNSVARNENVWKVECLKNSVARKKNVWIIECLRHIIPSVRYWVSPFTLFWLSAALSLLILFDM